MNTLDINEEERNIFEYLHLYSSEEKQPKEKIIKHKYIKQVKIYY